MAGLCSPIIPQNPRELDNPQNEWFFRNVKKSTLNPFADSSDNGYNNSRQFHESILCGGAQGASTRNTTTGKFFNASKDTVD